MLIRPRYINISSLGQKLSIVPWMRQQDPGAQSSLSVSLSQVGGFHTTLLTAVLFSPFWKRGSCLWFPTTTTTPTPLPRPHGFNLGYFNPAWKRKKSKCVLGCFQSELHNLSSSSSLLLNAASEWSALLSGTERERLKNLNGEAHTPCITIKKG